MEGSELDWEMETVNAFISGDPFDGVPLPDWSSVENGKDGWVAGTVNNVTKTKIKNGKNKGASMAFVNLDTKFGVIDCVVFNKKWIEYQDLLKLGQNILLFGEKSGELSMKLEAVMKLEDYKAKVLRAVMTPKTEVKHFQV